MKPIFCGIIKHGKIIFDNPDQVSGHLRGLECKNVVVTIARRYKNRSIPQNKYYWKVIVPLVSEYTGYTKDETHESLKAEFLKEPGEVIPKVLSTTILTTVQFQEYNKKIQRFFAKIDPPCIIPDPDPNKVEVE